jgi:Ricin-type beta-trefoil lectin domain
VRRYLKRVAITTALGVAATIGISSPAWAVNYGSYQNRRQGACLDSNSSGEAYTLGCNTGQYQDWDIQNISGNLYYLKNRATGLCLDANSSNKAYTLSCNGGTNQRWTRVSSGYGQWKNYQTGKCLESSVYATKQDVFTANCDSTDQTQLWIKI